MNLQIPTGLTALVFIALTGVVSGCSHQPSPQESARINAQAQKSIQALNNAPAQRVVSQNNGSVFVSDLIAPQDILDVNVFKVADLSAQKLIVESNGTISLPLIGTVKVQGLTIAQAEKDITTRLKKFMQDPKVSIARTDKAVDKRVTVEGEVKVPGVFPIKGNLSFLQAIALSQGLTRIANTKSVLLYRDGGQHRVNLELVRVGKIADPVLRNDDRIVVLIDKSKERERKIIEYLPAVTAPFSVFR